MAKTAQSRNIQIKPLDHHNKSIAGYSLDVMLSNQRRDGTPIKEIEINSELMNTSIRMRPINTPISNTPISTQVLHEKTIYLSGNKEHVIQEINKYHSQEKQKIMLKNRNELWFQKIIEAFESPEYANIFVAGGVGHFIGLFNVLDMLEAEGFTIQRLSCSADPSDIGSGP